MAKGKHRPAEEFELFQVFEECADWIWEQVGRWKPFDRKTIGEQLVRAVDSINANLVEGDARYGAGDGIRFFIIARASAREARLWLHRAGKRGLIAADDAKHWCDRLTDGLKQLNLLINYRRGAAACGTVRERRAADLSECGFEVEALA